MYSGFKYTQQKIIHSPDNPSHFKINNVFVSKGFHHNNYYIKKVTMLTLPKPYSTDCHDYSQYAVLSLSPRSQSYCMFEYMRKEEFNKCGKNTYWIQYVINLKNLVLKFKNESLNECFVKYNYKLLSRL